jgi:HEAT repeat protein
MRFLKRQVEPKKAGRPPRTEDSRELWSEVNRRKAALKETADRKDLPGSARAREIAPALNDPCRWVRVDAASLLGYLGLCESIEPLSATLSDGVPTVRSAAVKALVKLRGLGYPEAGESLASVLDDESPMVRQPAALCLGALGDDRAFAALVDICAHNTVEAAWYGPKAAEYLLSLLRSSPHTPSTRDLHEATKLKSRDASPEDDALVGAYIPGEAISRLARDELQRRELGLPR